MVSDAISMTDLERCIVRIVVWFSEAGNNAKQTELMMAEVSALYPDLPLPVFMAAMYQAYRLLDKAILSWKRDFGREWMAKYERLPRSA